MCVCPVHKPIPHYHVDVQRLDEYTWSRHNRRSLDTERMMAASVRAMVGLRLPFAELVAGGPAAVRTGANAEAAAVLDGYPL